LDGFGEKGYKSYFGYFGFMHEFYRIFYATSFGGTVIVLSVTVIMLFIRALVTSQNIIKYFVRKGISHSETLQTFYNFIYEKSVKNVENVTNSRKNKTSKKRDTRLYRQTRKEKRNCGEQYITNKGKIIHGRVSNL